MDILDILLDILLKPPQPFIGLFLFTAQKIGQHVVCSFCVSVKYQGVKEFHMLAHMGY